MIRWVKDLDTDFLLKLYEEIEEELKNRKITIENNNFIYKSKDEK